MSTLWDALTFDDSGLVVSWEATRFAPLLASLGRGPVVLDPTRGGTCVLNTAIVLGLPFTVTLRFDAAGVLTGATLAPRDDPKRDQGGMPDDLPTQTRELGAFFRRRRAALVDALGEGTVTDGQQNPQLPCPPMTWTNGRMTIEHRVYFAVERGGDPYGWLTDEVQIRR